MKFVFNDSLIASVPNDDESSIVNFVSSNIILEKKVVTSATLNNVDELVEALSKLTTERDKSKLLDSPDAKNILSNSDNVKDFIKKMNVLGNKSNSSSGSASPVDRIQSTLLGGAEQVGQPAEAYAPFLESKDQIISRLKPFMSEQQIGETFDRLEKLIPFTEVIGLLEYLIQKSRSCFTNVSDLINFFIEYYGQKFQYARAKNIIDLACDYQKLNPSVDIFSVLKDAIAGNQPKVGLGYLSKDPESQLSFNNLVELSQSNLPEQSEEIRRRYQASRDALRIQQQKVNMQKAIYDMMKTEEMNQQLVKMIKFLGQSFEFLITQPMYRALRDMFYDLNASKILLNQASSIFLGDTSPETANYSQFEEQQQRDETFTAIPTRRQQFSNIESKYLKLASPEITRHIYAQTAPVATQQQKNDAKLSLEQIFDAVSNGANTVVEKIKQGIKSLGADIERLWNSTYIPKIIAIYDAIKNLIRKLINSLGTKNFSLESISQEFNNLFQALRNDSGTGGSSQVSNIINSPIGAAILGPGAAAGALGAFMGANLVAPNSGQSSQKPTVKSNVNFQKVAQRIPQQGTTYPGNDKTKGYIINSIGIIASVGTFILGAIFAKDAIAGLLRNPSDWSVIVTGVTSLLLGFKNNVIELFMQLNLVGGNAPQSAQYFDNAGNMTAQGKQRAANFQETMISLGVADQDAMALGKFRVQKTYLMEQLSTKERNLQAAETQAVQVGGGNQVNTVGDLPQDFQTKLKDFLDFTTRLETQFKAVLNIFRNAINNNMKNFNEVQKTQAMGELAEFQKDLIEIQQKKSQWSSMKNIAGHMMRKRILLQKLKPLEKQLDTMKKLGIPMANIIASPNGILPQVSRIRNEEQQSLEKLRKEYYEKMELLKNPDKIAPLVKLPNDTGVTKLPQSPDQSEPNESPFNVPEDSKFNTNQENDSLGEK
jgi:hypothetical protein